jgi:hypothetical protein
VKTLDCLVSKSFLAPAGSSICLTSLRSALTAAACSEAERIVFAAEGLLLAHDFPFNCGIRVHYKRLLVTQLSRKEIFDKAPREFCQLRIVAFAVGHGEAVAGPVEEMPI